MRSRTWMALGAVALAALALGVGGVALAQDDDGDRPRFIERVAEKLGIDTQQLEDAVDSAATDMLDEAVAEGRISPERAERLKERLEEADGFPLFGGPGHGRWHGPGFGLKLGLGVGSGGLVDLAEFLGISPEQLGEELAAEGATLGSVAEAHGKTRDELHDYIVTSATERIDEAVANGRITAERGEKMKGKLDELADRIIDSDLCGGFRWHGPKGEDMPAMPEEGMFVPRGRFEAVPGI